MKGGVQTMSEDSAFCYSLPVESVLSGEDLGADLACGLCSNGNCAECSMRIDSLAMTDADKEDVADIEAVLNGDEDAYQRIVERHSPAVQKQMRNFSRDPLVQEELAQDVFVEAYLGLGNYRGDAPFRHWLARIATLTGYKFWKKRDKGKRDVSLSEAQDLVAAKPDEKDPNAAAELLYDLLATLPAEDRLILTLMYLENVPQEEIADRIGGTRVVVAVKIYRAKQKLKKLGEQEPWEGRIQWMLS